MSESRLIPEWWFDRERRIDDPFGYSQARISGREEWYSAGPRRGKAGRAWRRSRYYKGRPNVLTFTDFPELLKAVKKGPRW